MSGVGAGGRDVESPDLRRNGLPVAIVGAHGFLGRRLALLLAQADVELRAYTRDRPAVTPNGELHPGLRSSGTVFWLASTINPSLAETEPGRVDADAARFQRLLDAVPDNAKGPRVVILSSGGTVYDPAATPPYTEHSPVRPTTAYGRAKVAAEQALLDRLGPSGRAVVARVANAYGPGQPAASGQGVIAHWLRAAAAGEPVVVYGDPMTTRDYVYVDDVADALLRIHWAAEPPSVVNVGSGRPTTLAELANVVLDAVGDGRVELQHRPARSFDRSRSWLDVGLAERALGWRPSTDLATGVAAAWRALPSAAAPR